MPVLPGNPPLDVTLRRSAQSRRFSLRVSRLDGQVTLSMPVRAHDADALAFLRDHETWLRRTLARMQTSAPQPVGIGSAIPLEGRTVTLVAAPGGRQIRVEADNLLVPGTSELAGRRVGAWLKARARDRLAAAADHYAARLGRQVSRLSLRDTRSRWGSCSPDGALMFNWRLILGPPEVLDCVAAHEAAHLVEMNHSDAFWTLVARLCPDYAPRRAWLRTHGAGLQRLRFGD
jgi:predicted metal-dependent hydrolase